MKFNFSEIRKIDYLQISFSDACTLPVLVGPCNGSVTQYYYDRRYDGCFPFDYSGCQGNKNRFQDLETCSERCVRQHEVEIQRDTTPHTDYESPSIICVAPVDAGPCNKQITSYFYNVDARSCQAFIYGGCEGNANRFQTQEQCERLCGTFHKQGENK